MNRLRLLSRILRLAGTCEMLAFFAVVMPRSWMEVSHAWLGMGVMPEGSVLMYMIRQASYTYGMHGVSLWVLASDPDRFRPMILLNGISYLLAGVVFFIIDHHSGMPLWWSVGDSLACGSFGAAMLVLIRR